MKKLLLLFVSLNFFVSYSQENINGNSPVQGIIPIKRGVLQENKESVNRAAAISNTITPGTPTGNSTEVGVTEGQLSVSLTGGANYNIPIAVPPGINGIVPQVSLSYNSQGGSGLAGYGWNISGVSVITRIPSTKFHDNTIDAVDFNSLDRFAFDGQRLIVKNGTAGIYGANGTVYETEGFSNVQITSYGVNPSGANYGPAYFIVQYPDGSIAQYGNSTTSRSLTDWAINYWQNPQGVRISYYYTLLNNNLSISTIKYGTSLTTIPINEILFVYKNRTRSEQAYIGGLSFIRSTILSEIKVKGNNIGFRNYLLTHEETSLGYERLKSITEKSGDNTKSFNPTVFNYDTTTNSDLFQISNDIPLSVGTINFTNSNNISGDFDGDGKMDFILYPTAGSDAKKKYWLFNDIQGTGINIGSEHNLGSFSDIFPTSWLSVDNKLMPAQGWCAVQTNSITNITTFNNYSIGTVSSIYFQYYRTYQFPKLTFGYWTEPCNTGGVLNPNIDLNRLPDTIDPNEPVYNEIIKEIPKEYISGDFNGDGLTDVIIVEKPISVTYYTGNCSGYNSTFTNPSGKAYFLNLDSRIATNYVSIAGYIQVTSNSKFTVADINGDGKSDLMVFDSGSVKTYYLNDNKQLVQSINFPDANILSDKPRYMGDFNGDGKIDFVIPQADNTDSWSFFFSKGNSFQKVTTGIGFPFATSVIDYFGINGNLLTKSLQEVTFVANDINGDGKTDIILQANYTCYSGGGCADGTPQVTLFRVFENKGFNGTAITFNQVYVNSQVGGINRYPLPVFLDHNNVNQNLEYALISGNNIRTFKSTKDNRRDTQLKEIVLGNGVKEVITYQTLSSVDFSYDNVFEPSTYTENYPNFDIKVANNFKVVSKLDQVSATQNKQQKFKYYGAVSNVEGLGFLGFRGLARTNWFNEANPVISSISKHDITKRGVATETYSVLGESYGNFTGYTPTNFINKTNITYVDQLLPNKVYKINNSYIISTNGLEGTSKEVTTIYDTSNNPLSTTSISKNGTNIERTEIVNIKYFPSTTSPTYILGRLGKKNSSVTHNGDTMTGEEIYSYNTAHLVSKIQKKGHLTNYLTEDNSIYDVFGNIKQKKITAVGLTPRITNFTYDPTGRFLLSSTDIEGLITTYTYNTSNGLLLTQTLPSNAGYPLTTTYLYDVWGKKTKETDYLGKSLNYSYLWLSAGTSGFFTTGSTGDDNSASFAQYDDLGRKIADGFRTINDASSTESNNSWKTFEYDIYDRAIKTYEPKLSLLPLWEGLYSTTTFDSYGRTTQVLEHTGKTSNINYIGLTTTASDGVSNSTVVKNSLGNIVSKTDNGGIIDYQYYANGNLKTSNFGGVIVAVEQDGWGRKTKLIDPSAGTYEYQYNEFGEMKKEITPKGVTTYTIDTFGKVTEKTIVGTGGDPTNSKTTYTFNPTTKLLTNTRYDDVAGGFYTLYSYGYDNYKRINFNDESGFNAYYQRATQFDAFGRSEKELYTAVNSSDGKQSSKWVKNTYKNGNHWQILDDATNQVLWQTTKVNASGQLTNGNYGNGIFVTNSYDQYGFPTQFKHDKTGTPSVNVMTLKTVFEPQRGNLTSRYNSMFDYKENYTYDNLDRLSNWSNNNVIQNYTFTGNTESFLPTTSNVIVTNTTTSIYSRLTVTTSSNFEGTKRKVKNNAVIGDVLEFTGNLIFKNLTLLDLDGLNFVNYSVVERDPSTGQTNEIQLGSDSQSNTFSFQHTVSQYSEIYLKIVAGNDFNFQAPVSFSLDNIKVSEVKTSSQTYDALGRIDENNVGTYNYTNINPSNSVPKHFQNSSIETNSEYSNYYLSRADLDITYNAFKSPINIIEEGKDKLSFIYNMNNSRSTMYYGSLEADKLARRYRKHYSADGSMEIKQDMVNGTVEFITYIGGDGYSAPIVLKSDGTTQNYLYLHRDYLGSIVAVTNQTGVVVEKRLFDAWGNIAKVQDGAGNNLTKLTVLDRGYTGHEHLQGVNLIHMNGRLYDPVIHRFLQPDNFVSDSQNTQAFNRYSYVLNNPLKYSDASGELPILVVAAIIGAIAGGAGYIAYAIQTGNWSWGGFGMAVVGGAAVGALTGGLGGASATSVTLSAAGNAAASSFVAAFFPAISVPVGDWSFSISPSIAFGNASGAGVSFGVSYSDGDWSFSGGVGIMSYGNYNGFGANANEIRYSILANYDDGKTGLSLGTNFWRGDFKQQTGIFGLHSGDVNFTYENDGMPFGMLDEEGKHKWFSPRLGNGGDSFRTAAASLSIGEYSLNVNLFTGKRDADSYKYENSGRWDGKVGDRGPETPGKFGEKYKFGLANEQGTKFRLGALSVGYKGYKVGVNSEWVRHYVQNVAIHGVVAKQRMFLMTSNSWNGYFQYNTPNIFTSW
jgi:RHS repeat-associated protein